MKRFFGIFFVCIIAVVAGCDLQPKIASIPDDVGDFISTRYPTLLAEPDSEIYKTAVADYGVYASATEYGNGDVTEQDYVLYSPADDYTMPAQDTDVADDDVGMPDDEESVDEPDNKEEPDTTDTEINEYGYAPDTDVQDLKIPDYVAGKPVVDDKVETKVEPEKPQSKKVEDKKTESVPQVKKLNDDEKALETMRAPLRDVTVASGDTLYSISRKYSVPVNDLAVLNKISAPFTLSVGQKIKVPDVLSVPKYNAPVRAAVKPQVETKMPGANTQSKSQSSKPATTKVDNKKTDVKKTVPESVKKTEVKKTDVKKVDATKKVDTSKKVNAKTEKVSTKTTAKNTKATVKDTKTGTKKQTSKTTTKTTSGVETKKTTKQRTTKTLAARSASKFSWPLRGKILSGFGSKPNGLVNDGINIAGTKGAKVMAAENGFVAYAGNEVKGMGNLIIIQHSDGFMTVYAHMDTMSVRRGATVVVGQKIGTVGQSGKVDRPQLHFEIRKGTRAYNPVNYLKK